MNRTFSARFFLLLFFAVGFPASAQRLFWEDPQIIVPQGAHFSQSSAGGGLIALCWQELVEKGNGQKDIYLSLAVSRDAKTWTKRERFFGPVPYTEPKWAGGLLPPVYSLVVDGRARILIAVAVAEKTTAIILSEDGGKSFRETTRLESRYPAVTPALAIGARGGYILFVTESGDSARAAGSAVSVEFLSLYSSVSPDGKNWSAFSAFVSEPELRYNFQPQHASFQGLDYVVFQSRSRAGTYQLYLKISRDGGASWESAREITELKAFREAQAGKLSEPIEFTNQRPFIAPVGNNLGLVWERNVGGARPQIYYCELDAGGNVVFERTKVATTAESIYGQIVSYKGSTYVLYSDSALAATRISMARKSALWDSDTLSGRGVSGISINPHAVTFGDQLIVFWEIRGQGGPSLTMLRPDTSVESPRLSAVDFTPGKRSKRSAASIKWVDPRDPALIKSYHYEWSLNGVKKLEKTMTQSNPTLTLAADEDGTWELSVTAEDYAGNVSPPARMGYVRDTTPPRAVTIGSPETDAAGFLLSNTFSVSWTPPTDDEIAGYSYGLQFISAKMEDTTAEKISRVVAPRRASTSRNRASFDDEEDGVWAFSVSAIDTAGNVGEPATTVLRLNKYIPYTAIYRVDQKADEFGLVTLAITGKGFTAGGRIERVALSPDGKPPFMYEFHRSKGDFTVVNDRLITGPKLTSEVKSGTYGLSVYHPVRRFTIWKDGKIAFEAPGTIKIGDFSVRYLPGWVAGRVPSYTVPTSALLAAAVIALLAALIVISARKMAFVVREGAMIREEVTALIEGRASTGWIERNKKMREMQRKGAGLRFKFTLLMIILVILIVLIVSIPLSIQMIDQQRTTLAEGLKNKAEILLGSLALSSEIQISRGAEGYYDASFIPDNKSAMGAEALWATVTGPGDTDKAFRDYVWASNDPEWNNRHANYSPATERMTDDIDALIPAIVEKIEADARQEVGMRVKENETNVARYNELIQKRDQKSLDEARAALAAALNSQRDINKVLKTSESFTWVTISPAFKPDSLGRSYVFYKPIVFLNREKDGAGNARKDAAGNPLYTYYQGMVRLAVSTSAITAQIIGARNAYIRTTAEIALAAIALGILGAILLASITVIPIKKLAAGVAIIRDTVDKEELKSHTIEIRTRDEIGMLAETVNDMTKSLVKAAIASKDLMVGQDVQKMFLPLEKDAANRKGTTGGEETPKLEIYGYYEGAKGVSGDYFDFKKLDENHYAIIKCDVAGKGVSGALIMVEVATLFISYFRNWVTRKGDLARVKDPAEKKRVQKELERIDTLVYTINDMIEERGFKGRFAQLTVCLFDTRTGTAQICHAGDKIMHLYKADLGRMTHKELNDVPAAGVFPSELLDMKSGFKQIEHTLSPGDVMFLITDGFEESRRLFRDGNYAVMTCAEPDLKENEVHEGTHKKGDNYEEFGYPRIDGIVDAVFSKGRYRLIKNHGPISNEELVFDFSACTGSVKEAVLALASVEKVFRLYRDPSTGSTSKILVGNKVDDFLKDHFLQYSVYFSHRMEAQDGASAVTFTHLHEDDQLDDLTMIALRRK